MRKDSVILTLVLADGSGHVASAPAATPTPEACAAGPPKEGVPFQIARARESAR
jgi:hypothetical protein